MTRTILAAPVLVLTAALALTGCGSDSKEGAVNTPASSAPAAPTDTEAASAEFLTEVQGLVDSTRTPAEHAAAVEGGDDLEPTFVKLAKYLSEGPAVTFAVKNPVISGETAKADIEISSGGSALEDLYPSFFAQVDGHWKITRTGACSLIAVSGITCPDLQ